MAGLPQTGDPSRCDRAVVPIIPFGHLLVLSYLVRAVFKDSSFMQRVNLEHIQTYSTNLAPIDLPPRCMLALNERANQRPDLLSNTGEFVHPNMIYSVETSQIWPS